MKTTRNLLSIVIAAGAPGVALLALSNIISADIALAILSIAGIAGFAAYDYSRKTKSLRVPGRVLRANFPVAANVVTACTARRAA